MHFYGIVQYTEITKKFARSIALYKISVPEIIDIWYAT